jgi:ABC-type transport system involved in cytochrome bd biosynthesis fused ATPase/permease subunit
MFVFHVVQSPKTRTHVFSRRVLYAPLGFFLRNPVGEILVAFTKDQDIMDASLVDTLHYLGIYGLIMLATVITVSITIPMFSIFAGVLFIVTFIMLWFYLPAATTLKKHKVETGGEDQSQPLLSDIQQSNCYDLCLAVAVACFVN